MALLLLVLLAVAQPAPPGRGEGHQRLDALAGSWEVTVRFRYGGGPERTGRASMQAAWTLDGKLLRQDYNAESGQVTLQFYGFDVQRGKYFVVKFDNFDTGVVHAEGNASSDGRTITTVGDRVDPMTGKVGSLRIVLTMTDADHFTVEWFMGQPDGSEQRTVMMEHSRVKKP